MFQGQGGVVHAAFGLLEIDLATDVNLNNSTNVLINSSMGRQVFCGDALHVQGSSPVEVALDGGQCHLIAGDVDLLTTGFCPRAGLLDIGLDASAGPEVDADGRRLDPVVRDTGRVVGVVGAGPSDLRPMRSLRPGDIGDRPAFIGLRGQDAGVLLQRNLHSLLHILGERRRLQAEQQGGNH